MAVVLVGAPGLPEVLLAPPAAPGGMAQRGVVCLVLLSVPHATCVATGLFKTQP